MKILNWIKKNKYEFFTILLIILVSLFFRLYKINEYMTFLGDEGRDAIVVKDILTNFHFPLLGPPTSIGNMYLGPLYYYMMAFSMLIIFLNPVAAAVMVALIGTGSMGLIYYFSREWFGKTAAAFCAILYLLSPVNIIYSRSSWNPNPAPFFALLSLFGFYQARKSKNYFWFVLTGVSLAFSAQMHYLALILLPVYGILWLYELYTNRVIKDSKKNFWFGSILALLLFLFLMSPLVIFDLRHNFMNYRAISTFFGNRETTVNLNIFNTLGRVVPIYSENLLGRYLSLDATILSWVLPLIILIPFFWWIYLRVKRKEIYWPVFALGVWLLVGVLGLAAYKQTIYDHYLGFLNPVPYLLFGALFRVAKMGKNWMGRLGYGGLILIAGILIFLNLQKSPLFVAPNNQLKRTQEVSKFVILQSQNKPFNFALIAEHNYDAAYQFYLDIFGHKPKQLPFENTEQLFVVCEDQVCQPVGHPKYEIAAFGWTKIESVQEILGVKVFKLVHNYPTK